MGSSIDALKLVSSLTLFRHVARKLHAGEGLQRTRRLPVSPRKCSMPPPYKVTTLASTLSIAWSLAPEGHVSKSYCDGVSTR